MGNYFLTDMYFDKGKLIFYWFFWSFYTKIISIHKYVYKFGN